MWDVVKGHLSPVEWWNSFSRKNERSLRCTYVLWDIACFSRSDEEGYFSLTISNRLTTVNTRFFSERFEEMTDEEYKDLSKEIDELFHDPDSRKVCAFHWELKRIYDELKPLYETIPTYESNIRPMFDALGLHDCIPVPVSNYGPLFSSGIHFLFNPNCETDVKLATSFIGTNFKCVV